MAEQLFLSHRNGRPVARASISRWIREVMYLSGIDISHYAPHSSRGASISEASRRGLLLIKSCPKEIGPISGPTKDSTKEK